MGCGGKAGIPPASLNKLWLQEPSVLKARFLFLGVSFSILHNSDWPWMGARPSLAWEVATVCKKPATCPHLQLPESTLSLQAGTQTKKIIRVLQNKTATVSSQAFESPKYVEYS